MYMSNIVNALIEFNLIREELLDDGLEGEI